MKCPDCGSLETKVTQAPSHYDGGITMRRQRQCANCGAKFYTYEIYDQKTIREALKYRQTALPQSNKYDRCANCKHDESTMCEDCTTMGGRLNRYVVAK